MLYYDRLLLIAALLMVRGLAMAQGVETDSVAGNSGDVRCFVVVSTESRVPIRDVIVYTDDGQTVHSQWDGTVALCEGYGRITLSHRSFEKRIMLRDELVDDTVYLIPGLHALREVVVYGQRRNMAQKMNATMSRTDAQLAQGVPQGFSPLGLLALAYDQLWGKKQRHRAEMKKQKYKAMMDNY